MAPKLSKRLTALSGLVTAGFRLADVGTDHGYIPIYLVLEGKIPSAIAMDIRTGPLNRAKEHIAAYGLEDKIETRISDGVAALRRGEADSVLIAGMGGGLVQKILSEGDGVLEDVRELILQPQSEIPQVRKYLMEHGYVIVDEDMVKEDGKFYPMMKVHKMTGGSSDVQKDRVLENAFGPVLLKKKHPVLLEWLDYEFQVTEKILKQLEKQAQKDQIVIREREIIEKQELLLRAMRQTEHL